MAFARSGDGNKAVELLRMMYPITRVHTPQDVARYKAEPYVLAGDVYALPSQIGRGGWTWYTGSSGWMYRIWLEEILGFQMRGDRLRLAPVLHSSWEKVALSYRYKNHTRYEISIENPHRRCRGEVVLELDGKKIEGHEILLTDDGAIHHIRATIQS
jgi:cellobiose phosphorylase